MFQSELLHSNNRSAFAHFLQHFFLSGSGQLEAEHWRESRGLVESFLCEFYFFKVEELIETEQRRRRRETLEEGGHLGGNRNNLEEEARELTRLKEQVKNKVSRRQNIWNYWTSNCK